jgi:hypothetical protein
VLFRIYLHNFKYGCFYEKPSREDIPEDVKKKYLPETVRWSAFGPCNPEHPLTAMPPKMQDEEKAKSVARLPKGDKQTSAYFLMNVNFFAMQKGFDAILAHLKTSKSLFLTKLLLKIPYGVRFDIHPGIIACTDADVPLSHRCASSSTPRFCALTYRK